MHRSHSGVFHFAVIVQYFAATLVELAVGLSVQ